MDTHRHCLLHRNPRFLLFLTVTIMITTIAEAAPLLDDITIDYTTITSQSPQQQQQLQKNQLNNIIDALIGSGDFNNWANVLSLTDPSAFPLSATLFIPTDDSISLTAIDSFVFPYHIVPQRLTFDELLQFHALSRLPTLLPSKTILITNNSQFNFTLDDSLLSHPNFYVNPSFAVHGIAEVLNYSVYGEAHSRSKNSAAEPPPMSSISDPDDDRIDYQQPHESSNVVCLLAKVWSVLFIVCSALALGIPRTICFD